jgi:hypothetical protein
MFPFTTDVIDIDEEDDDDEWKYAEESFASFKNQGVIQKIDI